jgi:hypothetical protein
VLGFGEEQPFFCWPNFTKNQNFENEVILEAFNSQKFKSNRQISIAGFQCAVMNIEG